MLHAGSLSQPHSLARLVFLLQCQSVCCEKESGHICRECWVYMEKNSTFNDSALALTTAFKHCVEAHRVTFHLWSHHLSLSHPLALVPPSFWHFASLTGSEPVESRLGLTRCLCLSHRELWNTETHWLHLTLGIRLPCSAWYNRAIHSCFCASMLTFMAALTSRKKEKRLVWRRVQLHRWLFRGIFITTEKVMSLRT